MRIGTSISKQRQEALLSAAVADTQNDVVNERKPEQIGISAIMYY